MNLFLHLTTKMNKRCELMECCSPFGPYFCYFPNIFPLVQSHIMILNIAKVSCIIIEKTGNMLQKARKISFFVMVIGYTIEWTLYLRWID